MHKLRELGRRRLWVRLPKFRQALDADICPEELNDLFEAYALAAERLEDLRQAEQTDQLLVFEYEVASRGIEEKATQILTSIPGLLAATNPWQSCSKRTTQVAIKVI